MFDCRWPRIILIFNNLKRILVADGAKLCKYGMTKLLLLLFASAIFWFSMANAYTFDVTNRNPFGTLNLSELIIKNSSNTPTIEISWYVVQINTNQWKLIVHQICDDNGNCTNVEDIATWWSIPTTDVMAIIAAAIGWDLPTILSTIGTNITTHTNNISDITGDISDITGDMDALNTDIHNLSDQINWMVTWDENFLCVKNGSTLDCNVLKLWNYVESWGVCYYDENEKAIQCNAPISMPTKGADASIDWPVATDGSLWWIKVGYTGVDNDTRTYGVQLDENYNAFVNVPREWEGWAWGGIEIKWEQPWKWCRYNCAQRKYKGSEDDREPFNLLNRPVGTAESIIYSGCYVECGQPEPEKPEYNFWTGWDWTKGATVVLKDTSTNMNIWWSSTTTHKLEVNGDVLFNDGLQVAHFTNSWVRFYGGMYFIKEKYAYENKDGKEVKILEKMSTWLSVNWPFAVWNADNYLYIDADWNSWDAKHSFDIMWNNELAIGTKNWAFLYFTQKTWTTPSPIYTGTTVGIDNTEMVNATYCEYNNRWNIASYNIFWWNIIEPDYCSSNNTIVTIQTWNLWNSSPVDPVKKIDAYKSLMVGVNNNNPVATLDVNGSIKVWNNCVPIGTVCNYETQWTMMYLVRKNSNFWSLVICMANGFKKNTTENGRIYLTSQYQWYDVTRWIYWDSLTDLSYNVSSDEKCEYPRPRAIITDEWAPVEPIAPVL